MLPQVSNHVHVCTLCTVFHVYMEVDTGMHVHVQYEPKKTRFTVCPFDCYCVLLKQNGNA